MKKQILTLFLLLTITACTHHNAMGIGGRFHVDSTASLFAPSVTTVTDTQAGIASTYAGPSIIGQVAQAAGTVAGGYLIGQGLSRTGDNVSVANQNQPTAYGGSTQQTQGQMQMQAIQ